MLTNKEAFLNGYFAETNREKQLSILKDYLFSLSAAEMKEFMMEPVNFLSDALKSKEFSEKSRAELFAKLDELTFLMGGKLAV